MIYFDFPSIALPDASPARMSSSPTVRALHGGDSDQRHSSPPELFDGLARVEVLMLVGRGGEARVRAHYRLLNTLHRIGDIGEGFPEVEPGVVSVRREQLRSMAREA